MQTSLTCPLFRTFAGAPGAGTARVWTISIWILAGCDRALGGPGPIEQAPVAPSPAAPLEQPCPAEVPTPYASDPRAQSARLIVVFKSGFHEGFYSGGRLVSDEAGPLCFPVALGKRPQGPKTVKDNASTPEGWYHIAEKRDVGQTSFYRGFLVSYPNEADADRALALGVISAGTHDSFVAASRAGRLPSQGTAMGGSILLHGLGSFPNNWTWGCVGADNETMDVLFPRVRVGDPILIVPWAP